jgi:uncharacterized protein (DUF433 family)
MKIKEVVEVTPEKMGGMPVFRGTKVPISDLFHYLASGETLHQFLDLHPDVTPEQVRAALFLSKESLLSDYQKVAK